MLIEIADFLSSSEYTTFDNKYRNSAKYVPFIGQLWSDQVMLSDSFKLSGPQPPAVTDAAS